jgi:hypothetical protein
MGHRRSRIPGFSAHRHATIPTSTGTLAGILYSIGTPAEPRGDPRLTASTNYGKIAMVHLAVVGEVHGYVLAVEARCRSGGTAS